MKKERKKFRLSPLARAAEEALKEAVRETIQDHKRTGHPLAIWRNGKVMHVSADQIDTPKQLS